jgi:hypothetical protein
VRQLTELKNIVESGKIGIPFLRVGLRVQDKYVRGGPGHPAIDWCTYMDNQVGWHRNLKIIHVLGTWKQGIELSEALGRRRL